MRSLLVTNHKGGVGKTFVAVHLAKWFARLGKRVLVVDCDGQYDAYRFLRRAKPTEDGVFSPTPAEVLQALVGGQATELPITVIANRDCKSLRSLKFVDEDAHDYVILDADARLADAVKNILQNKIKLVLAPVNFQTLGIENLDELFLTVGKLYGIEKPYDDKDTGNDMSEEFALDQKLAKLRKVAKSVARHVFVVPLGANDAVLTEKLRACRVKSKVYIGKNMPFLLNETNAALAGGTVIWEMQGLSDEHRAAVKECFKSLAGKVEKFFDDEELNHADKK